MFLYSFMVPLLPYILEKRLLVDPERTQSFTSILLAETAVVSALSSPAIGSLTDNRPSKRGLMILSLCLACVSTVTMAAAKSRKCFLANIDYNFSRKGHLFHGLQCV
jgi:MFS-type transporter involved in bile tolerance (Atg22 family)